MPRRGSSGSLASLNTSYGNQKERGDLIESLIALCQGHNSNGKMNEDGPRGLPDWACLPPEFLKKTSSKGATGNTVDSKAKEETEQKFISFLRNELEYRLGLGAINAEGCLVEEINPKS